MKKISFTALVSMVLSCVICSIAVNWVALPNGFVVTGITGLAMTAQAFTGINYALIYYGLMLLILVLTFVMLGYREVSNILFLSFLYPLVLWVLNHWTVEIILKEKLIAVMFFGVIYGVGAGITYRLGYSYGGTDTLAKLLKQNGVEMGQKRLFQWMRENGFLIARKGTDYNMPTQKSMELGLFEIKERTISDPAGVTRITKTPKITGKGQTYFINRFLREAA